MSKVALYFKRWKNYSRHKSKSRVSLVKRLYARMQTKCQDKQDDPKEDIFENVLCFFFLLASRARFVRCVRRITLYSMPEIFIVKRVGTIPKSKSNTREPIAARAFG